MIKRLLVSAAVSLAACAPTNTAIPADAPYIVGIVTAVNQVAEGWRVRVEERPHDATGTAKGVFRTGTSTEVRRLSGERVGAGSLREGQRVRVWVTGPVAESYPVQATARLIVIDTD